MKKALIDNSNLLNRVEESLSAAKTHLGNKMIRDPFYEDFKNVFCWSSNAIEGNTLSLDETITFLSYDEVKSGHSFREYEEAKKLFQAINETLHFSYHEITESDILEINKILISSEGYRTIPVYIGNRIETVYYPPNHEQVPELMRQFMSDINFRSDSIKKVIEKTALKHFEFERIHPFKDGNGRTGRIVLNQMLINNDLLPIAILPKSRYIQSFKRYDKTRDTSMLEKVILECELESANKIAELSRKYENSMKQPPFIVKRNDEKVNFNSQDTAKDKEL